MVALDPPIRQSLESVIAPLGDSDRSAVAALFERTVGCRRFRRGTDVDVVSATGLGTWRAELLVGAVTFVCHAEEAELLAIAASDDLAFTDLLNAARERLMGEHRRIFIVAYNCETDLHRRLMRSGFRMCALRAGAVRPAGSAGVPSIVDGVAVTDELEFESLQR